ncbi:MAG: hypothetical protein JRI23_30305, partial [Deltaproteobacteria bacterium]|nr:hypothetical protein [Deltaproteobacteria bacterium]MBW2536466.1 hypothetical protein [Deltaproteobacteria bacterium]
MREGETDERLLKLATAASKSGMHVQASRALERVIERRGGHDAALERRLAAERERALAPVL